MLYNSEYQPISSTGGVLGTSLVDLTSISFADLFAQAADYSAGTTYNKGTLAYSQNTIWVYINATASSGNAPPALPTISNTYWELVGSAGTFTWIAYASSADGLTNFTTNTYDSDGITRTYIGIANNKTTAVESGIYTDYSWSKFVGTDGVPGAPAKSMVITSDRQLVTFDSSGLLSPSPQNINFTANKQNTTATVNWTIKDTTGNVLTPSSYLNNTAGDTTQMTGTQFRNALLVNGAQGLVITATLIDGITIVGTISVMKVQAAINGVNAVSAYITSEAQSLFAYANGNVVSFANANGLFKVYSGTTDVTSSGTGFSAVASGCTGTINTAAGVPVAGQPIGYYRVTAMSADTATLTLSATYSGTAFTKVYSLSKTRGGYEIVTTLPTTDLFEGRVVFLTTDDKLYRYTGTAWVTSVPATDISGTLVDAQISALAASKVTGQLSDTQLAAISAAKVTGQIVGTQITDGAISTAKIAANSITSNEIAANTITAADIAASTITATEIASATITAAKIAASTITSSQIAADTITANNIAANAITSSELATNAITADKITAGAITAGKIAAASITSVDIAANSITASNINANGLSIKDTNGNIILSAGSAVNFASLSTSFPGATNIASVSNSSIIVGGRNLIQGSSSGTGWSGFTTRTNTTYSLTAASAGETAYIYSSYFNMWGGQEITVSFESREDSSIVSRDFFLLPDNYAFIGLLTTSFSNSPSGWTKYSFTFTTPAAWGTITSPASARLRMDHNGSTGGVSATIYMRNVKIELGNKATDWTPAPEDLVSVDLSNAPSTIKNSTITISGGAITGIGTGNGAVVDNTSIAINGSGQITGIGTGTTTTVANSQITVSGGTIKGIGTGNGAYIASNLEESSSWVPGSAVPWSVNGTAGENSIVWDVGPKGATVPVWRCASSGDGEADGGWNHNNAFTIYPTKTYRFMVPVKFTTIAGPSSGSAYWGIDGNTVCNLNTTTLNDNPYFHAVTRNTFTAGRWYLMIGYVYPAGTTGASNTGAYVYDMTTGAIVASGTNYTWAAATTLSGTRAYQYYAPTAGNVQVFGQPVVEVVDGSESSINELLQASAIFNQNITISGGAISGIGTGSGTAVANSAITMNSNGAIGGAGGGQVTIGGLGYTGALNANNTFVDGSGNIQGVSSGAGTTVANGQIVISSGALNGIGTGSGTVVANNSITISGSTLNGIGTGNGTAVVNGAITMNSNGTISGAGGGQVTIGGLGYSGDLNATNGATIGSNLSGAFTEAEFNARFNTNVIGGTYIKDAAITDAKIANLSANKISSGSISTSLLVLDGLRLTNNGGSLSIQSGGVDTAQIALQSVTRVVAVNNPSQLNPTVDTWTTFSSATINVTSGTSVRLDASLRVLSQVSSFFGSDAQIRIIRTVSGVNTVVLSTFISTISAANFTIEFDGGFGTGTFNYNMATNPSVVFVDAHNSSGAILYTVQVLQNGGTGFENLTFVCTEIRR